MDREEHTESVTRIVSGTVGKHFSRKRSGDLRRVGVRCVCQTCNNGWMSIIQENNKAALIALATNKALIISIESQILLATWIAVFVTCSEYRHKDRATVSLNCRHIIYTRKVPPPTWAIWIGRHDHSSKWNSFLKHYALRIADDFPHGKVFDPKVQNFNSFISTFSVGSLFIHVMGSNVDQSFPIRGYRFDGPDRLFKIWPPYKNSIYWPPPDTMSDQEAEAISNSKFADIAKDYMT